MVSRAAGLRSKPPAMRVHPLADGVAVLLLTGLAALWLAAYWRSGLSYSPDSGLYMLYAARLHQELAYNAGSPMYAPLFSALVALLMVFVEFPGQATVLLLAACLEAILIALYAAARLSGATVELAFLLACWLFVLPTTSHVFGFAWTEGVLLADLLLLPLFWALWIRGRRLCWLAWFVAIAAAAPLAKYVALFVPVLAVGLMAADASLAAPPRRVALRRAALLGSSLAFTPIALHMLNNRVRWGTFTAHRRSDTPLSSNASALFDTLLQTLGQVGVIVLGAGIVLGCVEALRRNATLRGFLREPAIVSLALGLGYFTALVAAATRVAVDPIDLRLAAPGLGPLVLAAGQGLASFAAARPGVARHTLRWGVMLAIAFSFHDEARRVAVELEHLALDPPGPSVRMYASGFGASSARMGLSDFYRVELERSPCVSVTHVNAERQPGRVRREWLSIASALAGPPMLGTVGSIRLQRARRERIAISVEDLEKRLIFLPARISTLKKLKGRISQRRPVERARALKLLQRAAGAAREHGCDAHWLVVPAAATWFDLKRDDSAANVAIAEARRIPGFHAFRLQLETD